MPKTPKFFRLAIFFLLVSKFATAINGFEKIKCKSRPESEKIEQPSIKMDVLVITNSEKKKLPVKLGACIADRFAETVYSSENAKFSEIFILDTANSKTSTILLRVLQDPTYNFVGVISGPLDENHHYLVQTCLDRKLPVISFDRFCDFRNCDNGNENSEAMARIYLQFFELYNWRKIAVIAQESVSNDEMLLAKQIVASSNNRPNSKNMTDLILLPENVTTDLAESMSLILAEKDIDFRIFVVILEASSSENGNFIEKLFKKHTTDTPWAVFGTIKNQNQILASSKNWSHVSCKNNVFFISPCESPDFAKLNISKQDFLELLHFYLGDIQEISDDTICNSGLVFEALWALQAAAVGAVRNFDLKNELDIIDLRSKIATFLQSVKKDDHGQVYGQMHVDNNTLSNSTFYIEILQLENGSVRTQQVLNSQSDQIDPSKIHFIDDQVPISVSDEYTKIKFEPLEIIAISSASLGVLVCLFFVAVTIYYRKKQSVTSLSPNLNILCAFGSFIGFSAIIVLFGYNRTLDETYLSDGHRDQTLGCWSFFLALKLNFVLITGALIAKQFRVHKLFNCTLEIRSAPINLSDKWLIASVLLISLLSLILFGLLGWFLVETNSEIIRVSSTTNHYLHLCEMGNQLTYSLIEASFDYCLLAVALYFSWKTRQVKIDVFNDSQKIGHLIVTLTALHSLIFINAAFLNSGKSGHITFGLSLKTIIFNWIALAQLYMFPVFRLLQNPDWVPETSTVPLSVDKNANVQKYMDDVSRLRNVDDILKLYVRICEMWASLEKEKLVPAGNPEEFHDNYCDSIAEREPLLISAERENYRSVFTKRTEHSASTLTN